jgi:hypothetical protein
MKTNLMKTNTADIGRDVLMLQLRYANELANCHPRNARKIGRKLTAEERIRAISFANIFRESQQDGMGDGVFRIPDSLHAQNVSFRRKASVIPNELKRLIREKDGIPKESVLQRARTEIREWLLDFVR